MNVKIYTAHGSFLGELVQDIESPEGQQGESLRITLGLAHAIVMKDVLTSREGSAPKQQKLAVFNAADVQSLVIPDEEKQTAAASAETAARKARATEAEANRPRSRSY